MAVEYRDPRIAAAYGNLLPALMSNLAETRRGV